MRHAFFGLLAAVLPTLALAQTNPFVPGRTETVGAGKAVVSPEGEVHTEGALVEAGEDGWKDYELKFEARVPETAPEAQIWAAVRCADRDRRYVVGLRGGNNQQLYISRYAALGGERFLGYRPLNFTVKPGEWYAVRIQMVGEKIAVYLRDEKAPFMVVTDSGSREWPEPSFFSGKAALGGGYLPAEYRKISVTPLPADTKFPAPLDLSESAQAKEQRRQKERAGYRAVTVSSAADQTLPLDGKWLFLPDYSWGSLAADFSAPETDDSKWHLMPVPQFWTPTLAWLFGEQAQFTGPFMGDKGQSDNWWSSEEKRCDGYTFDWRKTKAAWYRQHLNLPADLGGKRYELQFDAIAKYSELYVNGKKVADNLGMFRELKADVTKFLKPGENVIAVKALSRERLADAPKDPDRVVGVAITVEVTARMLSGIPEGMYRGLPAGIWQPVRLKVTDPAHITDTFFQPRLDGAKIDTEVENSSDAPKTVTLEANVESLAKVKSEPVTLAPGETKTISLDTGTIAPKLWSPGEPNLYKLTLSLAENGAAVDQNELQVGFRTFAVSGKELLLNGKPYWLRGGNLTPEPLKPNDAALADRFLQLAHDNNVRATRSHVSPFTSTWLDAADRIGVGVSYEGTWPWLMLDGGVPAKGVLDSWRSEWLGLLKKYRNHPSILMWTVNNEMHLDRAKDPELRQAKWTVLSDAIQQMRAVDPTRPVVADSGYARSETMENYTDTLKPNHLDDGDVDDFHLYSGWYNPSFYVHYSFNHWNEERLFAGNRPVITQELATGYPRIDDGLPTRFYKMTHLTPQALVGDASDETADPQIFLSRVETTTKMLAEAMRRRYHDNDRMAGALHFSLVTWFKNAFDAQRVEPTRIVAGLKQGLSPVLVSSEIYGWHHYAGAEFPLTVSLVNDSDSFTDLPATTLAWSFRAAGGQSLGSGEASFPATAYYRTATTPVTVKVPETLPADPVPVSLHFEVRAGDQVVAMNDYPMLLTSRAWAGGGQSLPPLRRYDPKGVLTGALTAQKWDVPAVAKLEDAWKDTGTPVVIADFAWTKSEAARSAYLSFLKAGGHALLYQPGQAALQLDDRLATFRGQHADIVYPHVAESPFLAGINPSDFAWFTTAPGSWPAAAYGDYLLKNDRDSVLMILQHTPLHGYLKTPERPLQTGTALITLPVGKGSQTITTLALDTAPSDPVAGRCLFNLLTHLGQ